MLRARACAATLAVVMLNVAFPTTARVTAADLRMFPADGTTTASALTQISFRGAGARQITSVHVAGSESGVHTGRIRPHSDGLGASFLPDQVFVAGESVVVAPDVSGVRTMRPARFVVARPGPNEITPARTVQKDTTGWQSFRTRPDLHPPTIAVRQPAIDAGSGLLMLTASFGPSGSGPLVADYKGNTVWFNPLAPGLSATNLHVTTYAGKRVLSWWEGSQAKGKGFGECVVVDQTYRVLARVRAGNGYEADLHDFFYSERSAFLLIYNPIRWDLSAVGGDADGIVWDGIVQQVDVRTGLVMFEWHSLDHVAVEESYIEPEEGSETGYDYFHVNSVAPDSDDHLLVSARHTSTIYQIDRTTGDVVWRLGGKKSDFTIPAAAHFAFQHDAQRLPNGQVILFDNGAGRPQQAKYSSALQLRIDEAKKTVKTAVRFSHPERLLSSSQGSARRLPNGNTLIGWGNNPVVTEYDATGAVVFDASFQPGSSYRATRQPWTGRPTIRPDVVIGRTGDAVVAYVSWNGDTRTRTWELLAGTSIDDLEIVARVKRAGFETTLSARTDASRFALRAVDADGEALATTPLHAAA